MKVPGNLMRVGRVLHEDDAFVTIEVAKSDQRQLRVEGGDQFLTLIFVHAAQTPAGPRTEAWLPWEGR
jgi:hypothetical protein